jgi:hypothetical protein
VAAGAFDLELFGDVEDIVFGAPPVNVLEREALRIAADGLLEAFAERDEVEDFLVGSDEAVEGNILQRLHRSLYVLVQLWNYSGATPAIIRQQNAIAKYRQLEREHLKQLIIQFIQMLRKEKLIMKKKAFIVHGWDHELKLDVKNYLQNTLGIDCIILHEQDGEGDTIINKFERYAPQWV